MSKPSVILTLAASYLLLASVCSSENMEIEDETYYANPMGVRKEEEHLNIFERFLHDKLPVMLKQRPNNENGTMSEYEDYAMKDESNDDAIHLSIIELIERSGFHYERYDALADDGYITTLTRIINPLADRRFLRWPPVLLEHGGTIDPTAYLIASSIQHHPEMWPRTIYDGPITSWNRSIAFMLANNGFDVFIAETRGSNEANKRHVRDKAIESVLKGANQNKNMTAAENAAEIIHAFNYWSFSQDDIIAHELKSHIDTVLQVTNSNKLSLMTFSLSTPTSFAFISIRPDYAEKIAGFISMAPIVSGEGYNLLVKLIFQSVCPIVPNTMGRVFMSDILLTDPIRELIIAITKIKPLRYSLVKAVVTLLMGASAKFQTLLDLNVMGHMLRSMAFKEWKQLCQQIKTGKLRKFDYGPMKNKLLYNSTEPPVYDISNLNLKEWIVVSAENDALSTPGVIEHLLREVNPKPIAHIKAPGFNHLDLIAAFGNDVYVNLPIMRYLERVSFIPDQSVDGSETSARSLDYKRVVPPSFIPSVDTSLLPKNRSQIYDDDKDAKQLNPRRVVQQLRTNFGGAWRRFNPSSMLNKIKSRYAHFQRGANRG